MKINSFLLFLLLPVCLSNSISQWTSNANVNTLVCDTTGEQALVKVSACPDGGCWITWFDSRTGNYAVYAQKLDAQGNKQLASGGLLVSNNPQNSSLVDYSLICDDNNNAIIAFTDIRNSGQINPFAYKISPAGSFLWGANGVTLSDSINSFQPNPWIVKTSDGNFVFVWRLGSGPTKLAMQKLDPNGVKQWGPGELLISSGTNENYDWPSAVISDNGSTILYWAGYTGSFISPANYKLYSQKISSTGTRVWNSTQDTVYSLGRVSGFYQPRVFSDLNNGAIFCWRDDRNSQNLQTGYLQRINSSGTFLFPINGSPVSTLGGNNHFDPVAAFMPATGETVSFWYESNSLQSQYGVYGQKFSSTGSQLWGSNGIAFQPLNANQPSNFSTYVKDTNAICYYNESASAGNNLIKAFRTGKSGGFVWSGNIIIPGSLLSPKIRLNVDMISGNGMSVLCWEDRRNDAGGIYAQNINFDGSFGIPVGIHILNSEIPDNFKLYQNYPNPFNPETKIKFDIPDHSLRNGEKSIGVQLVIYDIVGQRVTTLIDQNMKPGSYEVVWRPANISSGIYLCKLTAVSISESIRLILNK